MRRVLLLTLALTLASSCKHEEVTPRRAFEAIKCNATGEKKYDLLKEYKTHVAWSDEFDGPQMGDDPSCFSRAPLCGIQGYNNVSECKNYDPSKLALLNKCKWWVYSGPNYMPGVPTYNQFGPAYVDVHDGHLTLTSEILHTRTSGIKCTYATSEGSECPMISGAIMTRPVPGKVPGYTFEGGYIEMKARWDTGEHGWPAFWILPHDEWPRYGEIDIMEAYAKNKNRKMGMTLHGVPIGERTNPPNSNWTHVQTGPAFWLDTTQDATYGVYWDKGDATRAAALWYIVNDCVIGKTEYGETIHSRGNDYKIGVPNEGKLFYMMLNMSMQLNDGLTVGPGHEKLIVDYVRYYDH